MDWSPLVRHDPAPTDGGGFLTTSRRAVWHTTEGASIAGSISWTRNNTSSWAHLYWDPETGEIVQCVPFTRAARAVKNLSGGVETNRWGAIQIEVVGHAARPFTSTPMRGRDVVLGILRTLGIPDHWPAGSPLPYPQSYGFANPQRSIGTWLGIPGHYGHSQVPENDHGDPGAIDTALLLGGYPPTPPEPPAPPRLLGMSSETDVKTFIVELTHQGFGLYSATLDPKLGREPKIIGAVQHGPAPTIDGWWTDGRLGNISAQSRGGKVIITAVALPGVSKGGRASVIVTVA